MGMAYKNPTSSRQLRRRTVSRAACFAASLVCMSTTGLAQQTAQTERLALGIHALIDSPTPTADSRADGTSANSTAARVPHARSLASELNGQPAVVLFWRSDCAPCLEELEQLPKLRAAAGTMRLLLLGLEAAPAQQSRLSAMGVSWQDAWYTLQEPASVLGAFGGYPPRLPLSVMLDANGNICARRSGVLGPQLIREWLESCLKE